MNRRIIETMACLVATLALAIGAQANSQSDVNMNTEVEVAVVETQPSVTVAGLSTYESRMISSTVNPEAGVQLAFSEGIHADAESMILATAEHAAVLALDVPRMASEYADIAVSQVHDYVNVRAEATTESEVVGKLYDKCAAHVLGTVTAEDGEWYEISSGNCQGYVKSEYVVVGDEALARSVGRRVATVTTETLNVRKEASTDASIICQVPFEDDLTVVDESMGDWYAVSCEAGTGYVSAEFVTLSTEYRYAESKAEEEARLAKEKAEREKARKAAAAKASTSSSSSGGSKNYNPPSGGDGQAVIDYALQFVGNPYVYGGTSLTNGADCSGFVMSVYGAFGVSLPHSSKADRSVGYGVGTDEMQAGDIVCYSGHVALYVGNNTIVHASNKKTGIITSQADYKKILAVRRIF